jgi:hypothetical protein
MEWTISLGEDKHYAEVVTSGIADNDGSLAMVKAISTALSETNIKRVLIDHRNISKVSGGIVDVYNRPKAFEEIGVFQDIKVAEVVKPEHRKFFDFLETVCVNRGYDFSIFEDETDALEWLLKA